ncbi:prolipoprotein diacylglyceryl transferase [Salinarimonas ramus]|uniref:Phosphatidylglycerol--prolipoprotein diacylglyceryl transferase n=1 Tax=Salinarimonas ramus TaxID=690164 RepID=A0A917Q4M0_9HYPH|nr:prolipoprotein diacylglyceryl transferase [Salinarimonas ramus]GGK25051.1 prolipoprotein diacylglyceryl transferase [Salinarimonas ramus]
MPFPDIDPIAIAIGPIAIRWYALAYIAGLTIGWWGARRLVRADGLWGAVRRPDGVAIDDLVVWVALGLILGGRLGYVLFYNLEAYLANPLEILAVWRGGMAFHGGLAGAIVAMILFARVRGLPVLPIFDVVAVVTPIGLFFGRIANFINGELWGRPAPDFPYAVVFPHGGDVPRYPSQLIEAGTQGVILLVVMLIAVKIAGFRRPGLIAGIFGIGYAVARIVSEFFREPDPQLGFLFGREVDALSGGITMGMLLSIPVLLGGIALVVVARSGATRRGALADGEAPSA